MKNFYTIIFVVLSLCSVYGQTYKQVKLYLNSISDIQILSSQGLEFDHYRFEKDNTITVFVNDDEFALLETSGFRYDVLISDWYEYFNNQPKLTEEQKAELLERNRIEMNVSGFGFGSMGGFYTLSEMIAELDNMRALYPNLITAKQSIGNSIENRPIYYVKISDNPDIDEDEPEVLYTALIHAREPESMMQMIYFMYYLLENYNTYPTVQYLVDNRELYFIPCINPDGYEYNRLTNPNGGGMWRKNRRNNGGSYGIDLNRNFGPYAYWNAPNGGSSTIPSSDTYRGTAPFSEPETNSIKNFLAGRKIKNALNYHTYSNLLIYPYGALDRETPDSLIFREYAIDMTRYNNYAYGTDMQTVGYSTRGNSDDYMYDGDTVLNSGKIFAMTPEVGSTGFWPSQSEIIPLAVENLYPNIYYAFVAGEYVTLTDPNFNKPYYNPGETVLMNPVIKNKGLSTGYNLSVQLTSLSAYANVIAGSYNVDSVKSRDTHTLTSPLSFIISSSAPVETKIQLLFTVSTNGFPISKDTVTITVGTPVYVLKDTTNNPSVLWTITGTPASAPKWAATTASYHSAPNSYTDSPSGNYAANSTITMTLSNPINLTGISNPILTFYTKYDIEKSWDYGQVKISTNNGSTWIPLQGRYTNPGSGSFQPSGEPVYDGTQTNWVKEEISLSQYISSQVKIRFELRSDVAVQKDGWYVDDIGIFYYSSNAIELTSFTALIEGLYDGNSMRPDTVTVELRNNTPPYSLVDQTKILLDNNGQGNGKFYEAVNGTPYYIVVKHRNSIETWSALPQAFTSGSLAYDFTTAADKAYGNNLKLINGKWCIYSGDVNQDGFVDTEDLNLVFIDNVNGSTGYIRTDLYGDLFTEIEDLIIVFRNNILGVERKTP